MYNTKPAKRSTLFAISRAEFPAGAFFTAWTSRAAVLPAKQNQPVTEITAFFRRKNFFQGEFYFIRRIFRHQSQTVTNPDTMGIGYDGRLMIDIPHNQAGSFPTNTGQAG